MKPIMWAALLASVAATAYVATQGGDEVEVVSKGGRGDANTSPDRTSEGTGDRSGARKEARSGGPAPGRAAAPAPAGKAAEAALRTRQSDQLMAAVAQLQTEALRAAQKPSGSPKSGKPGDPGKALAVSGPWGSQLPPPPPPAPTPPPAPPMVPVAPPFPHAWVGRYVDDVPRAVIAGPSTTWVLKVGDVIDGQWRIDTIQERQLGVTYLPLQQALSVTMK
jgi:hypothetical protein